MKLEQEVKKIPALESQIAMLQKNQKKAAEKPKEEVKEASRFPIVPSETNPFLQEMVKQFEY